MLGVKGWKRLPVFNVERIENGTQPYSTGHSYCCRANNTDTNSDMSTKFVWLDDSHPPKYHSEIGRLHILDLTNPMYLYEFIKFST